MSNARRLESDVNRRRLVRLLAGCLLVAGGEAAFVQAEDVLVTVNGRKITEADLQLEAVLRRVTPEQLDAQRESLLDSLIDQTLIKTFVSRKRARANPIELESQVERIHALIRRRGEEPADLFKRLRIDEDQLRDRLSLSLAWLSYVRKVTTAQQLRAYFQQHRRELNGTQLRAQHIIIKVPPDDAAGREAATARLTKLRQQINAKSLTFAAAAAKHSDGPSGDQGGDVGFFGHRGTMSADFADAAFALNVGEISQPTETGFGVHLIKVTEEQPGQLSLEDVRPQVLERISRRLWDAQIAKDRPRATIEASGGR